MVDSSLYFDYAAAAKGGKKPGYLDLVHPSVGTH